MVHDDTLAFYNDSAEAYREKLGSGDTPYLKEFAKQFTSGQTILDVGCGPGHCAGYFALQGLNVDAIDASSEMIKLASTQPGVTTWTASFDDIPLSKKYDGLWANFSLLHAPKSDLPQHLATLRDISNPNAILHLGLKTGQGSKIDHLGRYYSYYEKEELMDLLTDAGFCVLNTYFGSGPGMAGLDEPWIVLWSKAV